MTSATEKICRILSCLSDRRICKLTDIARFTDLDISSVLRILKDLEKLDFVEREPQTKEYTLGREIYAMHHAMVARQDIRALARPALVRMARKYGDSLILSIPSNWESVCVDTCLGDYPIRANYLEIGSRRPLGVGAGSLVLLAALSDAQQQMYLPCIHEQIDKRYPMFNQSMLKTQIALCRQQQYAVLCDVVVKQMGGIGVAIRAPDGTAIAALSLASLSERILSRQNSIADDLMQEARLIEKTHFPAR
ncbi:IclR family transcriptional regulator [Advenella incenata]|jgi:DNA-binding IclR family transcriptional regulator|uniref:IclR family transcriptional regulator n=1 Tax=Advenella incenata TaxID=267800 RepID=A0A4Q7V8A9_9BURK|nr:MarR family transcriptional regulator [Advenella incenata]RZT92921.1 IclR family transcriptional regulator [Advenella incenata]